MTTEGDSTFITAASNFSLTSILRDVGVYNVIDYIERGSDQQTGKKSIIKKDSLVMSGIIAVPQQFTKDLPKKAINYFFPKFFEGLDAKYVNMISHGISYATLAIIGDKFYMKNIDGVHYGHDLLNAVILTGAEGAQTYIQSNSQ